MDDVVEASCCCGQLTIQAEGPPIRVSVCHCTACQRRTGSAFGVQARFQEDRVKIAGPHHRYERTADSGNVIDFYFCPACGSTVLYRMRTQPDVVAVPVGAFADPSFSRPTSSVYEVRKHPWITFEGEMEHWD